MGGGAAWGWGRGGGAAWGWGSMGVGQQGVGQHRGQHGDGVVWGGEEWGVGHHGGWVGWHGGWEHEGRVAWEWGSMGGEAWRGWGSLV